MTTFEPDPEKYKAMSEPFLSHGEASAAIEAFMNDLRALREKHRIAEMVGAVAVWTVDEESGKRLLWQMRFSNGDPIIGFYMLKEATTAQAIGIAEDMVEYRRKDVNVEPEKEIEK